MQLKAFAIKDTATKAFERPFFQQSSEEAIRSFRHQVNNPQTIWHNAPEDFHIFYIGDYDTNTGLIQSLDAPVHVESAINVKKTELTQ